MELAKASGIETPRREDLAKLDRKRTGKGSNRVWKHPHDADARITRMKDGRTHLAHKAEHAVDLETGAIVSVTVQGADRGDTQTMVKTLTEAAEKVEQALPEGRGIEEVVADKGYHRQAADGGPGCGGDLRSYVSEPRRGKRRWRGETGRGRKRCMRIGGASGESEGSGCYGNEESGWSDPVRICTGAEG